MNLHNNVKIYTIITSLHKDNNNHNNKNKANISMSDLKRLKLQSEDA